MEESPLERGKTILLLTVALICLVLLFFGGPERHELRSHEMIWGLGHILCFAVWTALFLRWKHAWSFVRQFVVVFALTLGLGLAIELLQAQIGRSFDLLDIYGNLTGSLLTLAFFCPARRQLTRICRVLMQSCVAVLVGLALFPIGRVLQDEQLTKQQFPLLCDFESAAEVKRWAGRARYSRDRTVATRGMFSLKVAFNPGESNLYLRYFPQDWRDYSRLCFDIYSPDTIPRTLHFRMHDRTHRAHGGGYADRFNRSFELVPGWNRIALPFQQIAAGPQTRRLELAEVVALGFFMERRDMPAVLYFDHLRLEY